jgi:Uma2 family endonuclease
MGAVEKLEQGYYTMADLDAMPDDGQRRELVDGMLLVTPAPVPLHQTAVLELAFCLRAACPRGFKVFVAPLDFRPTANRSLQPDVLVCHHEDVGPKRIERPLLLAVEVLSPGTRMQDLFVKRRVYEESGVQSYWIVDPEPEQLTVLELVGGHYVERAVVKGTDAFEADLPYQVRIVPAELINR